jgi:hypothetical protein
MKVGSKWKCKVGTCIVAYVTQWLLTKHLKEVYGLITKKVKLGRPSTFKRGPQRQNHAKMNVCILGDAMAMQKQNDQKVVNHVHAKAERKWDKLVIVVEQCSPLPKTNFSQINFKAIVVNVRS